jgi:hypothetical protein
MASNAGIRRAVNPARGDVPRKRHWLRWTLLGAVAVVIVVVIAGLAFIRQPAPAPLALTGAGSSPAGPLAGSWNATVGSVAGFRVRETAVGFSNEVVGRTNAVTGTIVISGRLVTAAALRIGLASITVSGKTEKQLAASLGTAAHPDATFTLARPATLSPAFATGGISTIRAIGYLAMNGASRLVTVTISARRSGRVLQAAGSIPVAFARWDIRGPGGFGFLGSLASRGTAEFYLVLRRA